VLTGHVVSVCLQLAQHAPLMQTITAKVSSIVLTLLACAEGSVFLTKIFAFLQLPAHTKDLGRFGEPPHRRG
jgi:hypothetical protein